MKVLITGCEGQVGRALLATVPEGFAATGASRSELDLMDPEALSEAITKSEADVVVNAAAYTAVDHAEREEELAFAVNAAGVENLAKASARRGARLVHISTDFVFDGLNSLPYKPHSDPAPQSVYGRSKLAGEKAVLALPNNLVVRTAWVYSRHGSNFVKAMLRLMDAKRELRVVADQVGTPTHAYSLSRALWSLVLAKAEGVLHFTDAGVASWYDFAVAIQEEALAMGLIQRQIPIVPIPTQGYPTPAKRPPFSVLDKSETWEILAKPAAHWRAELREMLESLKEKNV